MTAESTGLTVGDALTRHYAAHNLPVDGGAHDAWFHLHIGPVRIPLPNPPARRRAVFFHDVNHVITGYNTTFSDGEMAIAAFEISSGCGSFLIAWFINLAGFAVGMVINPRVVFSAFVRGGSTSSIYRRTESRATLCAMTVDELRSLLGADRPSSNATVWQCLRFVLWGIAAWAVFLAPIVVVLAMLRGISNLWLSEHRS